MLRSVRSLYYNCKMLFRFTCGRHKVYQIGIEKPRIAKLVDLVKWLFREGEFNIMYYALGLNRAGSKQQEYIGRNEFLKYKHRAETLLKKRAACQAFNYDVITKDKFYANAIFKGNAMPCIETIALVSEAGILSAGGDLAPFNSILNFKKDFALKNTVLESGEGVLICQVRNGQIIVNGDLLSAAELQKRIGRGRWVLQERHCSHAEISRINASALNTTRIVTIMNGHDPVYLAGFQSFATQGAWTDGWDRGSIYVGIDVANSCLSKWGYYHPLLGGKSMVTAHPDSGVRFEGYGITFLKNAVDLCLKAHRLLYFNFVVGWDVAITARGPLIVEANEKPGMNAVQCLDGGLRDAIRNCFLNTVAEGAK